jgi:lysylphosphatidylglycerol synthetase-like protein (DUF2156 family)
MQSLPDPALHDALAANADNPSAFLALNEDTRSFTVPGLAGLIAYRDAGRHRIQLGGPFAPRHDYTDLLRAFLACSTSERRKVVAIQLQSHDVAAYARCGFRVNQVGASYAVDLDHFTLAGSRFMRLRNKISRARRSGLVVEPATESDSHALDEVDRQWLDRKGHGGRLMEFLVGERSDRGAPWRRIFVGRQDGRVVGYISYVPTFGQRPGWLHDLSRGTGGTPGVMEAINAEAITAMRAEGARWLHFGFTPFTGLDRSLEHPSASATVSRVVHGLNEHGDRIYPAKSQLAYKLKWAPDAVLPEYVAFRGAPTPASVWRLLRLVRAI